MENCKCFLYCHVPGVCIINAMMSERRTNKKRKVLAIIQIGDVRAYVGDDNRRCGQQNGNKPNHGSGKHRQRFRLQINRKTFTSPLSLSAQICSAYLKLTTEHLNIYLQLTQRIDNRAIAFARQGGQCKYRHTNRNILEKFTDSTQVLAESPAIR